MTRRHLEDDLQTNCIQWFRLQYPNRIILAIPNGGRRNIREAARLKRMGVLAGVFDLFIPEPNTRFVGLWIELKIRPNKLTKEQTGFCDNMKQRGYQTRVCWSFEDFRESVKVYLQVI